MTILPRVLHERSPQRLLDFESRFEKIGMPALIVQVLTGLAMARQLVPDPGQWLAPQHAVAELIRLKLVLLGATVLAALDARLRLIPRLSATTLPAMARRIAFVTLLSVGFVVVGVGLRLGSLL